MDNVLPFKKKNNCLQPLWDSVFFQSLLDTADERFFARGLFDHFEHFYDPGFYVYSFPGEVGFSVRADELAKHLLLGGFDHLFGYYVNFVWGEKFKFDGQQSRIPDVSIFIIGTNTKPHTQLMEILVEIDGSIHRKPHISAHDRYKDQWAINSGQIPLRINSEDVQENLPKTLILLLEVIDNELWKIIKTVKHHFGPFADCHGKRRD